MDKPVLLVPIVWFRSEDYDRIRAISIDGKRLPATYEQWREKAQAGFEHEVAQGKIVEKIYVDVDKFLEWCRRKGLDVDARARIGYVSEIMVDKYRKANE